MAFLWSAIGAAGVILVLAAVLLSSVRVRVRYSRSGSLDQLVLVVRALYGIVRIRSVIPSIAIKGMDVVYRQKQKMDAAGAKSKEEAKRRLSWRGVRRKIRSYRSLLRSTKGFRTWLLRTLRKIECTRWRLDVGVGTGDAALTGAVSGLIWAVLGCAEAATSQLITLRTHPHGNVKPNYSRRELTIVWEADFRFRIGTMILRVLRLGTKMIRMGRALRALRRLSAAPERA